MKKEIEQFFDENGRISYWMPCTRCGNMFIVHNKNGKYCPVCRERVSRERSHQQALYEKALREQDRNIRNTYRKDQIPGTMDELRLLANYATKIGSSYGKVVAVEVTVEVPKGMLTWWEREELRK